MHLEQMDNNRCKDKTNEILESSMCEIINGIINIIIRKML